MTNNIEKLYELAGVKKVGKKYSCDALDFGACRTQNCDICDKAQDKNYPPFTEFKQLALIKFFGRSGNICIVLRDFKGTWLITNYMRNGMGENIDFSQALATFVINVWDLLNDAGKQEIKRILE